MWSIQVVSSWPVLRTPGPAMPSHVFAISGWMPPWFHANV
jgi:hypothetical protein